MHNFCWPGSFVPTSTAVSELWLLLLYKFRRLSNGRHFMKRPILRPEKSGVTLENKLRKSNPWSGERCGRPSCFQCKTDDGGDCWRESVTYSLVCEECGEAVCQYFGESGRNGYSRGEEHLANKDAQDENKSVLKLHAIHHHNGRNDVNFIMKVTGFHSSSLDRQVTERVNIENFQGPVLMNRRNELGGVRLERMRYRRWGGD